MPRKRINRKGRKGGRGKGRSASRGVKGVNKYPNIMMKTWSVSGGNMPPRMKVPRGPSPGASYTTSQAVQTFTLATGLTTTGTGTAIQSFIVTGTSATFPVIPFTLADVGGGQISDLSGLFDQYRFEEVHLRFLPGLTASNSNNPTPVDFDSAYVVVDLDDPTALTSLAGAINYDNVQMITPPMCLDVRLTPNINLATITGGTTTITGAASEPSNLHWINLDATTVPFYGVKIVLPAQATGFTAYWQVMAWYKLSFRSTR